jgi:glycosyltransferase involved in cell wall biosynthesis
MDRMSTHSTVLYLEPVLKYHAFALQMQAFPPTGYQVIVSRVQLQNKIYDAASDWEPSRHVLQSTDIVIPTGLLKALVNRRVRPPAGAVASYSTDQLVFRKEPWVIEVEFASLLLGAHAKHLKRYRRILERTLSSEYCRAIRCWSEVGRQSLLQDLDARTFAHKVQLIHYAVPPRRFTKTYDDSKVKLLFVGSGTSRGGFEYRGGRETLEAFVQLRQRYPSLELVVRSDIPPEARHRYEGVPGLRIIEHILPRDELDSEFRTADIFVIPSHNTSPMIMLDAMSYELPMVTMDSWANPEYAEDGKTGFVARRSSRLSRYYRRTRQPGFAGALFLRAIRDPDPDVVADLVQKIGILVERRELRREMGRAARREIEEGRFSLARMNDKLGRWFDLIVDDGARA